jgi:hypothetical protein
MSRGATVSNDYFRIDLTNRSEGLCERRQRLSIEAYGAALNVFHRHPQDIIVLVMAQQFWDMERFTLSGIQRAGNRDLVLKQLPCVKMLRCEHFYENVHAASRVAGESRTAIPLLPRELQTLYTDTKRARRRMRLSLKHIIWIWWVVGTGRIAAAG